LAMGRRQERMMMAPAFSGSSMQITLLLPLTRLLWKTYLPALLARMVLSRPKMSGRTNATQPLTMIRMLFVPRSTKERSRMLLATRRSYTTIRSSPSPGQAKEATDIVPEGFGYMHVPAPNAKGHIALRRKPRCAQKQCRRLGRARGCGKGLRVRDGWYVRRSSVRWANIALAKADWAWPRRK